MTATDLLLANKPLPLEIPPMQIEIATPAPTLDARIAELEQALDTAASWAAAQLKVIHGLHDLNDELRAELSVVKAAPVAKRGDV